MDPAGAIPAIEFICHVDVCRLGLPVRDPRVIRGGGEVVVGEEDAVGAVARGGEADHPGSGRRGGGSKQERFEQLEEEEVRQVVGAQLGLESVGGAGLWGCHDA